MHRGTHDRLNARAGDVEPAGNPTSETPDEQVPGQDLGERRAADVASADEHQPELAVGGFCLPVSSH
jgi:hypothetical protein